VWWEYGCREGRAELRGSPTDIITFRNQPKFHGTTLDLLVCTKCIYLSEVHWPCLCRPSLVPFQATKIMPVANIWKPLDTMKIELRTCRLVHCRVQRQVVQLGSRYKTWFVKYSSGPFATRKFKFVVHMYRKMMEGEWTNGSFANEWGFRPMYGMTQKILIAILFTNIGSLNLCVKHSTECETVDKIQDTQLARLWSNDHVWYYRNLSIPYKHGVLWHVVDLQGWPTSQILL